MKAKHKRWIGGAIVVTIMLLPIIRYGYRFGWVDALTALAVMVGVIGGIWLAVCLLFSEDNP